MKQVIFTHKLVAKNRDLADDIKANLKVAIVGNKATIDEVVPHLTFDTHLPEGITPDMVSQLSVYCGVFTAGQYVAVMETSAEIFNEHNDVSQVQARVGVNAHGDFSNMTVDRQKPYPVIDPKEGEPTTTIKYLCVKESLDYQGPSFKALSVALSKEFKETFVK